MQRWRRRFIGLAVLALLGGGLWVRSLPDRWSRRSPQPTEVLGETLERDLSVDVPARGLIYRGLRRGGPGGPCGRAFEAALRGRVVCTPGPDPSPSGLDVRRRQPRTAADPSLPGGLGGGVQAGDALPCLGTGDDGKRVEAVYAHAADVPGRYEALAPSIRRWALDVDATIASSAAKTGGIRHVRFVTDQSCEVVVRDVALSPLGDDSLNNTIDELAALGYDRSDRKYLVWMDADVYCGIASFYLDDGPSPDNANNGNAPATVARTDRGCWGLGSSYHSVEAHELTHALGAVQPSAPNATPAGHCSDDSDLMCYSDGSGPTLRDVCDGSQENVLDCGDDDYFNASPAPDAYLGSHWDVASNEFLSVASTDQAPSPPASPAPAPPPPPPPATPTPARSGYWMLGSDGRVYPFGDARSFGDARGAGGPAEDLEPTPSFQGYWVVDSSGRVSSFGDAPALGGIGAGQLRAGETATSLSATRSGAGYWIFTTAGRVFRFGDAAFHGDMARANLNGPVLDSIPTATGGGYYMVASDGGIFAFGDARFLGSMGGKPLNKPVQSLVPDGDGSGYWLVAADGGVFAFDAGFRGSMGGQRLNAPITGMVRFGNGYLMVATDGGIFNFSDKPFHGSLGANPPSRPITAVAALESP